jgi:hypothetical protein
MGDFISVSTLLYAIYSDAWSVQFQWISYSSRLLKYLEMPIFAISATLYSLFPDFIEELVARWERGCCFRRGQKSTVRSQHSWTSSCLMVRSGETGQFLNADFIDDHPFLFSSVGLCQEWILCLKLSVIWENLKDKIQNAFGIFD